MPAPIRVLMITSEWPKPGVCVTPHFIKRQAEFLQAAGIEVSVFDFRGSRKLGNYVTAWYAVQRKLAAGRFDLVHAQFGQSGTLALPKRLPLVVTLRGSDILGIVGPDGRYLRKGKLLQAASRHVAARADAVIAVSEHMRAYLSPRIPLHIIPSGIDLELFRPIPQAEARQRLGIPADEKVAVFVGKPEQARKRFALAQAAVEALSRTMPTRLLVAWRVEHTEIPYYLAASDALLFTSMQEGSPNAVKEALACDVPVVSVAIGDVAERLAGIEGCEVCTDERPEAIAAALGRTLRRGGRVRGREAVRHLDEHRITEQVIAIYQRVLRREEAPAAQQSREAVEARA
jgi:glycosyltransferase involved in cell wall biosynthesis